MKVFEIVFKGGEHGQVIAELRRTSTVPRPPSYRGLVDRGARR